jgi:group II intron reverse transcriptase/maturase
LEANLESLLERFKTGLYKAPPVRRAWIPKGDGTKRRPLGIPSFEDKVLQRAVVMVLEAIYEEDFLDCSWGFRPNRSAHQALEDLWHRLMRMGGGWVLEVDIENYFETIDHGHLRTFLDRRVRDGVIRQVIQKWLKAGVLEEGNWRAGESGTPQGGVISPMLANIFLHEVLDRWFAQEVKPRLSGDAYLLRYADDVVMVFALESDARRVWEVLPKRMERFGLRLHPEKTRLVPFVRPGKGDDPPRGQRPGSFDLLGFRHYWGTARSGSWVVKRKTAPDRFSRTLRRASQWLRRHRHGPVEWQYQRLSQSLRGHAAYYGIAGNARSLQALRTEVRRLWHYWLARRSQRGMTWERFERLERCLSLPRLRLVHRVA